MALKPSEARAALAAVANRIAQNRAKLVQAKANITAAAADLESIGTAYGTLLSDINAYATANPSSPFATSLKAEKDAMVTEYQALNTVASAMETNLASNNPG